MKSFAQAFFDQSQELKLADPEGNFRTIAARFVKAEPPSTGKDIRDGICNGRMNSALISCNGLQFLYFI